MNPEEKIEKLQYYMDLQEEQLADSISSLNASQNMKKKEIVRKYGKIKEKAKLQTDEEKKRIQFIRANANKLINKIERPLYHRQVSLDAMPVTRTDVPLETLLKKLEFEISRFETSILPQRLRNVTDAVNSHLHADYGQTQVNTISNLYQSIITASTAKIRELDGELSTKYAVFDERKNNELQDIDIKTAIEIERRVDAHIKKLQQYITTGINH